MSYFTCEVHKSQFSSILALKEHVAKFHSDENGSTVKQYSSPRKKKMVRGVPQACKALPKIIAATKCDRLETPKDLTTLPSIAEKITKISDTEKDGEPIIQCHICGKFYSSSTELIQHLGTHFNDNLLPTSGKAVEIKTDPEDSVVSIVNGKITPEIQDNNYSDSSESSESGESSDNDDTNDPDFCPTDTEMVDPDLTNETEYGERNTRRNKRSSTVVDEKPKMLSPPKNARDKRTHLCPQPNCKKAFKTSWHLRDHIHRHTGKDKLYHCSWKGCGQKFARCSKLTFHYRLHTGEKPTNNGISSNCKCCKRNDKRFAGYQSHLPEGKLICYFCGYVPTCLTKDFDAHIAKHTLERPYRCKICNRLCLNDERLKEHAKVHTNDDISKRNFKCIDCGSRFQDPKSLRSHRLSHSTFRPYICKICSSSNKRFRDLRRHIQTVHAARKAYKCDICPENKVFSRKDVLRIHMSTVHSGVKYKEPVPQFKGSKITSDMYQIACHLCSIYFKDNARFLQHRKKCSGTIKPKIRRVEMQYPEETEYSSSESENSDNRRTTPSITRSMDAGVGLDEGKNKNSLD